MHINNISVGNVCGVMYVRLLIRNPRGTNWGSFRGSLGEKLERGPEMSMKYEAGLGLVIHWIQQALISVFEDNCPLRPIRKGRKSEVDSRTRTPQKRSVTAL
jgi:hypothetical protein